MSKPQQLLRVPGKWIGAWQGVALVPLDFDSCNGLRPADAFVHYNLYPGAGYSVEWWRGQVKDFKRMHVPFAEACRWLADHEGYDAPVPDNFGWEMDRIMLGPRPDFGCTSSDEVRP